MALLTLESCLAILKSIRPVHLLQHYMKVGFSAISKFLLEIVSDE